MKNQNNRLITSFEYILYIIFILFFSLGYADGFFPSLLSVTVGLSILLCAIFIILIVLERFSTSILINARAALLLTLLVVAAIHLTLPQTGSVGYEPSQLYPFYYVLIIVYASLGNGTLWLSACLLFLVSEFGWFIGIGPWNIQKAGFLKMTITRSLLILPDILYVFTAGGIAYFISTIRPEKKIQQALKQTSNTNETTAKPGDIKKTGYRHLSCISGPFARHFINNKSQHSKCRWTERTAGSYSR